MKKDKELYNLIIIKYIASIHSLNLNIFYLILLFRPLCLYYQTRNKQIIKRFSKIKNLISKKVLLN